jgi:hypothetical protein
MSESKTSMTVTRALAELKTLAKRIAKLTSQTTFVSTRVVGRPWHDHSDETQRNFQAVTDLIHRYSTIKYAIIRSNAETLVTIGGVTYTVAEAIAKKESISQQKTLLSQLKYQRTSAHNSLVNHDRDVQRKLDELLQRNFSKDHRGQDSDNEIKVITEAYVKNNKMEVVDPLTGGVDLVMATLDEEISSFEKEVDFSLSESNATTKVSV